MSEVKAFETHALGVYSYIWTETAGRAKALTAACARDAGFECPFTVVRCRRVATLDGYDALYRGIQPNTPYARGIVKEEAHDE